MRYKYNKRELLGIVSTSYSYAECLRKLGIRVAGGNYATLKSKIKLWSIDITHFKGQGWNVGLKFNPSPPIPLCDILVEYSTYQSYKLKNRLFKEELKTRQCEVCENTTWLGNPIALELHHINGVRTDHRFENLQILCPNCHACTESYRGKNINLSAQEEIPEVEPVKFGETLTSNVDGNPEPSLGNEEGVET